MAEIRHLENRHDVIFFCRGWCDLDKISQTGAERHVMSTGVIWSKLKPDVEFQYCGRLGEFNGMSSQSHLPHCRVLPPGEFNVMIPELHVTFRLMPRGEFTVMIPEPRPTLQGAVTWRNQCHDRATLQGVRITCALLKVVIRHILFFCYLKNAVWAFVSSPIHLFLICSSFFFR